MSLDVRFEAPLWLYDSDGGWHFVTLPADVADEIRDAVPHRAGFGSVRVTATIGQVTWDTSVFPDRRTGSFLLPVKRAVRVAGGVEAGDVVHVSLVVADPAM